jgi:hypothetical protein
VSESIKPTAPASHKRRRTVANDGSDQASKVAGADAIADVTVGSTMDDEETAALVDRLSIPLSAAAANSIGSSGIAKTASGKARTPANVVANTR